MNDYRIELKIKNNLLWQKMRERGIENQSELSRQTGVTPQNIGKIMALKEKPYRYNASLQVEELKIDFKRLVDFFSCEIEDIYPRQHFESPLEKNSANLEFHKHEVLGIVEDASPHAALEHLDLNEKLTAAMSLLTDKEKYILSSRHGINDGHIHTLDDLAEELGVGRDRIRQIEAKALRKLRNHKSKVYQELREAMF